MLRSTIKAAKDLYWNKLEQHCNNGDARHFWQGLQDLTGYKSKPSCLGSTTDSFLEELSGFYAQFERNMGLPELDHTLTGNQHCEILPCNRG